MNLFVGLFFCWFFFALFGMGGGGFDDDDDDDDEFILTCPRRWPCHLPCAFEL